MRSFSKPTDDQLDAALPLLSSPMHEAYFFDRLENPHWITPLKERNIFDYPPGAEPVEGGGVRFPHWPPSRYLARMASQAPDAVAAIFSTLETDNGLIIGDIVGAALAMPADVATALVPTICRAAQGGFLWIHSGNASKFCAQLAECGHADAALTLAEAIFKPTLGTDQAGSNRLDAYWYEEGLRTILPALARCKPRAFLPKLCDWLEIMVGAHELADPESGLDYSYLWRPAIEDHEQNRHLDLMGNMVGFAREAFEFAIGGEHLSLEAAIQINNQYSYHVFARIRLHLLAEFGDKDPELVRQTILDRSAFDNHEYKHEYAMLAGRRLDLLAPKQRRKWFGWIDDGPDMADFEERFKQRFGRDATDEDRGKRIRYWQFERLHWVRAHLSSEQKEFYQQMIADYGEPELADLNVRYSSGISGHESPMTVEELRGLPFEQAVKAVSSWQPEDPRTLEPTVEGLASCFGKYLATDPEAFSEQAQVLRERPAIYVRKFIGQMNEAAKASRPINILAVLNLCQWVLDRPIHERTTPTQDPDGLVDKDWQWTRDQISRFVESVCKARTDDSPTYPLEGLRKPMYRLIAVLCRDRADSYILRGSPRADPRIHDYLDSGINSTRGKAMEAAFEYARWVADHIKDAEKTDKVARGGFDDMPEIREVLEWELAPENRSMEALSIIGSRINQIYWIDKNWLEQNVDRLFDLQGVERTPPDRQGWAAWNAFLVWVRPHIEFYWLFRNQYVYAVEQSADLQVTERATGEPMNHLGEHLMILFGRGQLELEDAEGPLQRFLQYSSPGLRRHAIGFIGGYLERGGAIPVDVLERFQTLWEAYWQGVGKKDAEEKPDAWLFGTWFASGKFPEQWALDQLERFVEVVAVPHPDHAVLERLSLTANIDIAKAVGILDIMIRNAQEGWRIHGWIDSATQILEQAMNTAGGARELARALINYLGRRGYTSFGRLLVG